MKKINKEKISERLNVFLEQWENNPVREQSGFMYEKTFVDMMREFQQEVFQASIGDIPMNKNAKKK
jgi:aromatic ring-cleaving dioxygenase